MGYDESRIRIERKSGFRNWERNLNGEREREEFEPESEWERKRKCEMSEFGRKKKRTKWKQNPFSFFYLYIYLFITFSDRNLHPWDDRIQHTNNSDRCGPPQSPSFQMNGSLWYHPFASTFRIWIILQQPKFVVWYILLKNNIIKFKVNNHFCL